MSNANTLCAVPLIEAFTNETAGFRNCCSAYPQTHSKPDETFSDWWHGDTMQQFRDEFGKEELPTNCYRCKLQEQSSGSSFRTVVNATVDVTKIQVTWPSRWNVIFGNICNLGCWTCNENASSVIETHKRRLNILPVDFVDPQTRFMQSWPSLKDNILKSYQHHDIVTLTVLGGEPLYNATVIDFLSYLVDSGLSARTKLEFHTNATKKSTKIVEILQTHHWKYTCAFLSIDAVGAKAEWLRYGSSWATIKNNIDFFKQTANYIEVHCVLSVLNIRDAVELKMFCEQHNLPLHFQTISRPDFMSLAAWPKSNLCDPELLSQCGLSKYAELIGTQPIADAPAQLQNYIKQFDSIRSPLGNVDPDLAQYLEV